MVETCRNYWDHSDSYKGRKSIGHRRFVVSFAKGQDKLRYSHYLMELPIYHP